MAQNKVQYQRGLPMLEFFDLYGSHERCEDAIRGWRWPEGFVCPRCQAGWHSEFRRQGRLYFQCGACRHQCRSATPTWAASARATRPGAARRTRCRSSRPYRRRRRPTAVRVPASAAVHAWGGVGVCRALDRAVGHRRRRRAVVFRCRAESIRLTKSRFLSTQSQPSFGRAIRGNTDFDGTSVDPLCRERIV